MTDNIKDFKRKKAIQNEMAEIIRTAKTPSQDSVVKKLHWKLAYCIVAIALFLALIGPLFFFWFPSPNPHQKSPFRDDNFQIIFCDRWEVPAWKNLLQVLILSKVLSQKNMTAFDAAIKPSARNRQRGPKIGELCPAERGCIFLLWAIFKPDLYRAVRELNGSEKANFRALGVRCRGDTGRL